MKTPQDLWKEALSEMRYCVSPAVYRLWLEGLPLCDYRPGHNEYLVGVPDALARDWLESHMTFALNRRLARLTGEQAAHIRFILIAARPLPDSPADDTEPVVDWTAYGVPPLFTGESLETLDWSAPALQRSTLRHFLGQPLAYLERGIGLTLIGPPGVGKTHLAVGILKAAVAAGWSAHFTGVVTLLDRVRATFDAGRHGVGLQSEFALMRRLVDVRLLALDDLRVDGLTYWGRDRLYAILNARWESGRPTVVTGNEPIEALAKAISRDRPGMDGGTLSRLVRSSLTLEIEGEDRRTDRKRATLAALRQYGPLTADGERVQSLDGGRTTGHDSLAGAKHPPAD